MLEAHARLLDSGKLYRTPTFESLALNRMLNGNRIFFKCENLQRIGAFKSRGGLNAVRSILERGEQPNRIVAYSSGNHAQAVAWACQQSSIPCTIFMPSNVSALKLQATKAYGADVVLANTRPEAEEMASEAVKQGALVIPPFDHDDVICGQGTACLEALQDLHTMGISVDSIIAPVGGGGLISGTYLAAQGFTGSDIKSPPLVYGAEPLLGNDAAESYRKGVVQTLSSQPNTMADGAMTLAVSERTFQYVQKLAGIYEISEEEIRYWTQWLSHLLKLTIEPTSAMPASAAVSWLKEQSPDKKTVLCIISGGNIALDMRQRVWNSDLLTELPSLNKKN